MLTNSSTGINLPKCGLHIYIYIYDLVPKGAQMGGQIFDCQLNLFQTLCFLVALSVHS